jgi:hypothetical protein
MYIKVLKMLRFHLAGVERGLSKSELHITTEYGSALSDCNKDILDLMT